MLDNLVESRSNSENTKWRGGYLLTTSVLVFSLFASGILWSLFAKELNMGGDSMELSSMVAPVPMPDSDPSPPEPITPKVKQEQSNKTESNVIIRRENLASTDEPIPPKDISTTPNTNLSRPKNAEFRIGKIDENPSEGASNTTRGREGITTGQVISSKPKEVEKNETDEPPTIVAKKVEPKETPKVEKPAGPIRSSTILNGKALNLPKPPYPPPAKAIRVGGDVNVQVTIDEKGNVISASAVTGHLLLRQVSEQAARNAKFSPTILGGQPVKVTGLIVYKFAVQ